ncbi:ATP-binding protein [Nocardiopsis ganjiahuensis]|uniref:ATP-binding protein n=1 Tax=Nocardiopsis ganjiahuensis TaxID=239984 RepID=UPI000344B88C|nr:ATP-binding protein [Nocardiopsis ganjiahuensis]
MLLITSEITTNALLHSLSAGRRGAFVVSAFFYTHCLRVSVRSVSAARTRAPHLRVLPVSPDAEHGRGLLLVNALASTWGSEPTRNGPAVYFTLDWEPSEPSPKPRPLTAFTRLPHRQG